MRICKWKSGASALPFLALFFAAVTANAQTARITGRITDATGAVVPGTSITVINAGTAAERRVDANEDGYYTVPLLPPGEYRLVAIPSAGTTRGVTATIGFRIITPA